MFYEKIDTLLINNCQYLVWYIELSTPLGRKGLAKLTASCNTFFVCMFFILILIMVSDFDIMSILPCAFLFLLLTTHKQAQKSIEIMTQTETSSQKERPVAILTRYLQRKYRNCGTAMLLIVVIMMIAQGKIVDPIGWFMISLMITSPLLITFSEYFLCTSPLPPGAQENYKKKNLLTSQ